MGDLNSVMLMMGSLLLVSILAAVVSSQLGAPLLLVFLVVGMLAGEEGLLGIQFDQPEVAFLIGSLALVIIIFDGGMRTKRERFRVALWPAISLATVGVALTSTLTAVGVVWLFDMPWPIALLIGAILSSTDAAAVFGIFQSQNLKIKQRVASTLEIESGTNDPMAVILTMTMTTLIASGQTFSLTIVSLEIAQQLVIGFCGGWLGGRLFVFMVNKITAQFTFFPLMAAASAVVVFALTSSLGGSGFLAAYLMGYKIGNARLPQLIHMLQVQDGLAWLSQIMMFLILGLLVTPSHLIENLPLSLSIAGIMIFVVRPVAVMASLLPFSFPIREQLFISWVGLRGAVPIILALYPWLEGLPGQELFFDVAFVVVLVSLLLQGWTIAPMARWLKLEVPLEAEPSQRMALDKVGSNDPLELWSYEISERSPACDHYWYELRWSVPLEFVGLIREGEWLQPSVRPKLRESDHVLVVAKVQHIDEISRVLAAGGKARSLNSSDFFGDFTLNGELTLADVASFYPLGQLKEKQKSMSLHAYFSQKFHRRMVVGDQLKLGSVQLTIRELNEDNAITKVGVKLLETGEA
ncbi:K(+)/H(+) antiporter NhaP [Pseudidiomarina piscicola]|uniref:K(+)/H(+) antiporter NhaP n=1 Tax=Pseudidiomarina piscicola TaxID=2614830 RepID=A0A6S6WRJ6_9GAMM|nr:potassium/proton antiporter [Pseudidiomarina piscicola]CAB0151929.1 K(+)/H(+) antiporter NhaP [Pseudidiomarina piscicola]VZT41369.1 K(+)/H(+) antiporter NhaP [Pseudomonas aeruginosa]